MHSRTNYARIALIIILCLAVVIIPNLVSGQTLSLNETNPVRGSASQTLDALPPGQWYEFPNSKLEPFLPNPIPPNWGGPDSIMGAWSGGAYDTLRDRLIVWGGGHNDYGGNEIYTFDLVTGTWDRIWGPSLDIPPVGGPCNEAYSDGNPASRHTYDGLTYIPEKDWFWSNGGSLFCGSGGASFTTWVFDFQSGQWMRKPTVPQAGYSTVVVSSAYDPISGNVYHLGTRTFSEYNPTIDSWTVRGEVPEGFWATATAAIDPVRRLFVSIGSGQILVWDLNTWQRINPTISGDRTILNAQAPGFVYDPISKRFIGWSGGSDLYALDASTWSWSRIPVDAVNSVTPTNQASAGTFGRFQYIPSLHALIVVNSIYQNVYLFKLPDSSILGDLNLDGKVDAGDVQLCVDVLLGDELDPGVRFRADIDGNGRVDVIDLQMLINSIPG